MKTKRQLYDRVLKLSALDFGQTHGSPPGRICTRPGTFYSRSTHMQHLLRSHHKAGLVPMISWAPL